MTPSESHPGSTTLPHMMPTEIITPSCLGRKMWRRFLQALNQTPLHLSGLSRGALFLLVKNTGLKIVFICTVVNFAYGILLKEVL